MDGQEPLSDGSPDGAQVDLGVPQASNVSRGDEEISAEGVGNLDQDPKPDELEPPASEAMYDEGLLQPPPPGGLLELLQEPSADDGEPNDIPSDNPSVLEGTHPFGQDAHENNALEQMQGPTTDSKEHEGGLNLDTTFPQEEHSENPLQIEGAPAEAGPR
jgi:hypothetical protein